MDSPSVCVNNGGVGMAEPELMVLSVGLFVVIES